MTGAGDRVTGVGVTGAGDRVTGDGVTGAGVGVTGAGRGAAVLRRGRPAAPLAAVLVAAVTLTAACASSRSPGAVQAPGASTGATTSTTTTAPRPQTPATTVAGQLPTVYDCGGGAYEPATLLVVCGVGSAHAVGVHWTTWTASAATGQGSIQLPGHDPAPASLTLGEVVQTSSGPQFSQLTATWSGSSPDGHPRDVYHLATAPAQG